MNQAFVDTWAWVALVDKKDGDHEKAKSANKKLLDHGGLVKLARITDTHEKEAWQISEI
jgi:predicted nucleic acid-binding protein